MTSNAIPISAGIGLRAPHYREVLATRPAIGWWEVHSENYFGAGGPPHYYLERVRRDYPLSLHGVSLSLGSSDRLNREHLARLKALIERYQPGLVSEHLSWSSIDGRYLNDLLPLPYTDESLQHVVARISEAQDTLGRQLLIENPSSYLQYTTSTWHECDFLREIVMRSGCGLLLDVNNVYVSAVNHGFAAHDYLRALPADCVQEIHLAGHRINRYDDGEILIDTHDAPIDDEVWRLYKETLQLTGPQPTLIEWDTNLPPLAILLTEANRATALLEAERAVAA
ncbi:MAG: DUF692 domain-containing protein [Gammaproteobacteria bacterium]|nr:DUF692 domain-containing protein [Gammaproteobacteria bacterium]